MQSEFDDLYGEFVNASSKNRVIDLLNSIKNSEKFDATQYTNWKSIVRKNYEYLKYVLGLINEEKFNEFAQILKQSIATSVHTKEYKEIK